MQLLCPAGQPVLLKLRHRTPGMIDESTLTQDPDPLLSLTVMPGIGGPQPLDGMCLTCIRPMRKRLQCCTRPPLTHSISSLARLPRLA